MTASGVDEFDPGAAQYSPDETIGQTGGYRGCEAAREGGNPGPGDEKLPLFRQSEPMELLLTAATVQPFLNEDTLKELP